MSTFYKHSFSSTGLPSATRTHLEALITHLGGQATRTMSSSTTHLIVPNDFALLPRGPRDVPPTSGPKLIGALKWNARVVTAQWVVDVARGAVGAEEGAAAGYEVPWWPPYRGAAGTTGEEQQRQALRRALESLETAADASPAPQPPPPPPPPPPVQGKVPVGVPDEQQPSQPVPPIKRSASTSSTASSKKASRSKFRVVSSDTDSCSTTDDGSDRQDDTPKPLHNPPAASLPPPSLDNVSAIHSRLFAGYALAADGFPAPRLARLQSLVHQHAGTFLASLPVTPEGRAQYPRVRHWVLVLPVVLTPALAKVKARYAAGVKAGEVVVGSDNWLQHCLLGNTIYPLNHSFLFHPSHLPRLPALASHIISLSGFSEIDQVALESILAALGATLSPSLNRNCTLLLYASATAPPADAAPAASKFDKAMQWNIPVVPLAWLQHVLSTCAYARPDKYRVRPAHLVFDGLVVYVTPRAKAAGGSAGQVAGVVEVHGGKVVFAWTASVTHVVHFAGGVSSGGAAGEGRGEEDGGVVRKMSGAGLGGGASGGAAGAGDGEREVKLAKAQGKWVVSPWWVSDSVQAKHRLPEINYPPNYDPARQLQMVNTPAYQQPLEVVRRPSQAPAAASFASSSSSSFKTPHVTSRKPPAATAATAKSKKVRRAYDPDVVIVAAADGSQLPYSPPDEGGASARKRAKVVSVSSTRGSASAAPVGSHWSMARVALETPSRPPRAPKAVDTGYGHGHGHGQQAVGPDYGTDQQGQVVDMDVDDDRDVPFDPDATARLPPQPMTQRDHPIPGVATPRMSLAHMQPSTPTPPPQLPTPSPPPRPPTPPAPPAPPAVDPIAQDLARKQAQMTAELELMLADLSSHPPFLVPPPPAPAPFAQPLPPPSPKTALSTTAADVLINLSAIYTQTGSAGTSAGGGQGAPTTSPRKPLVTYDDPEGARARKKLIAATTRGIAVGDGGVVRAESAGSTTSAGSSTSMGRHWAAMTRMMQSGPGEDKPGPPPGLARSESESSVVRKMVEGASLGGSSADASMADVSVADDTDSEQPAAAGEEADELESSRVSKSVLLQQQCQDADAGTTLSHSSTVSTVVIQAGPTSQLPNAAPRPRPLAPVNAPRIALSGCATDRDTYEAMIAALGGHLMSNPTSTSSWVHGTTHLVISVPISCEKCMCAIASGAWLLRPSFIDASYRAGRWVGEAEHTWAALTREGDARRREVVEAGERAAVGKVDIEKSLDLISGWERVFRTIHGVGGGVGRGTGGGAFRGWRALLVGNANTSSYRNLLMAGGASIVSPDGWDPDKDPDAVTHVLVQSNRLDPQLAANDIVRSKTYSATLIIQSLMGDHPPTPVLLRRMSSRSFGSSATSSTTSTATSTSAANASGTASVGGGSTGRVGVGPHLRQQQFKVQATDVASTGSTAY